LWCLGAAGKKIAGDQYDSGVEHQKSAHMFFPLTLVEAVVSHIVWVNLGVNFGRSGAGELHLTLSSPLSG